VVKDRFPGVEARLPEGLPEYEKLPENSAEISWGASAEDQTSPVAAADYRGEWG